MALNGMCIRKGREGFQTNIGSYMSINLLLQRFLTSVVGSRRGLHVELKDNRNADDIQSSSLPKY